MIKNKPKNILAVSREKTSVEEKDFIILE